MNFKQRKIRVLKRRKTKTRNAKTQEQRVANFLSISKTALENQFMKETEQRVSEKPIILKKLALAKNLP